MGERAGREAKGEGEGWGGKERGGEEREEKRRGRKTAAMLLGWDLRRRPAGRLGGCSDDLYARDG